MSTCTEAEGREFQGASISIVNYCKEVEEDEYQQKPTYTHIEWTLVIRSNPGVTDLREQY